jgi:hypothetical protein
MNTISTDCDRVDTLIITVGTTSKKMSYLGEYLMTNSTSAYAVINGVQARGEKGDYSTERVKFNSNSSA